MGLLERIRPHPAWKDADPKLRRSAARSLDDPAALAELARGDEDDEVRREATESLLRIALEGRDDAAALLALAALGDPKHMLQAARSAESEAVSRAGLARLGDARALGSVARHGRHPAVRMEALRRLADPAEVAAVALKGPHEDTALAALERLAADADAGMPASAPRAVATSAGEASAGGEALSGGEAFPRGEAGLGPASLTAIATHARCPAAARRARALLREREEASGHAVMPRARTDRRKQQRLCDQVAALAASRDCEPLGARLKQAEDSWIALLPNVDDDLHERFTAACRAARERLSRNLADRSERQHQAEERHALDGRYLAPRRALCVAVDKAEGEEAPGRLEDARRAWEALSPVVSGGAWVAAEAEGLARRFEAACTDCARRHGEWTARQADLRRRAEEAAARAERDRRKREEEKRREASAARLSRLCDRLERRLKAHDAAAEGAADPAGGSPALTLSGVEPGFREIKAVLEDLPPLPTRREERDLLKRLKALHTALAPIVQELREAEGWKLWANANVQEELCARMEALREVADPLQAARQLPGLMDRWRSAAQVSKDRAQELWLRFRQGRDAVLARLSAFHAGEEAKKRALCEQVEALADSSEWVKTAEAIKRLQTEWKTIGPASRGRDKALWERFRQACDRFFNRRDEDLARRKDEWAKNLERKEALIARAEALAGSTDWKATADAIKSLQAEWKIVGPVRKSRSEAIWKRFHAACDRFFERYKRRDQIEMEANVAAREAILSDLERLLPPGDPHAPGSPGPEGLLPALRTLQKRWQQAPLLPPGRAAALGDRFHAALERLVASYPDSVRGTELDGDANRRKMEDLCARIEALLPGGTAGGDEGLSPVARLAAQWREALAANTIGGKAAGEPRRRAAAEEVRKARSAWERIGYVPEEARRTLTSRFEKACGRLAPMPEQPAGAPPRRSGAGSGRRRDRSR